VGLSPRLLLAVAAGGAAGGLARVAAELAASTWAVLPHWAALVGVNVLGSLLIGWAAARGGRWASPAVTTGVLGGFTSFSGWVLDVLQLVQPAPVLALLLLLAVPVACVAACLVGLLLGERG
jgi:CrcB protein